VTLLTTAQDGEEPGREERAGYTLVRTEPSVTVLDNDMFCGVSSLLREDEEFDVIHSHSHLYFSSNFASVLGKIADVPIVTTCHGLLSQSVPSWLSKFHLKTVGKLTYDTADVTFCYTGTEKERLRELGVSTDIEVVHNGIDTERFAPHGDQYPAIRNADGPTVLCVGRLVSGKRPDTVLDAFEAVQDSHPDATLVFCGDGPMREELQQQARVLGLTDSVELLGEVPYERMPSVYRAADVMVLASETEGFPRTVMESLACRVPVVASQLTQVASVVDQAGMSVEVDDTDGFADALDRLLSDPDLRADLGEAGRELMVEQYDWTDTVERTTAATKTAVESHSSAERRPPKLVDPSGIF
jgi:glycosyltransferase involved in cell wall biosynthesis